MEGHCEHPYFLCTKERGPFVVCYLYYTRAMHCQQIAHQIKSDEYLKYEANMKFIPMILAEKYKGFQV